jgi:hypothetical protein
MLFAAKDLILATKLYAYQLKKELTKNNKKTEEDKEKNKTRWMKIQI